MAPRHRIMPAASPTTVYQRTLQTVVRAEILDKQSDQLTFLYTPRMLIVRRDTRGVVERTPRVIALGCLCQLNLERRGSIAGRKPKIWRLSMALADYLNRTATTCANPAGGRDFSPDHRPNSAPWRPKVHGFGAD
jgi:hypothetical protein